MSRIFVVIIEALLGGKGVEFCITSEAYTWSVCTWCTDDKTSSFLGFQWTTEQEYLKLQAQKFMLNLVDSSAIHHVW